MTIPVDGEAVDPITGEVSTTSISVLPTHYKSPQTGALLEVENPLVWVYPEASGHERSDRPRPAEPERELVRQLGERLYGARPKQNEVRK